MSYLKDINPIGKSNGSWYPQTQEDLTNAEMAQLQLDKAGNLITRSAILTDEGSFYEPFAGVALDATWTNHPGTGGTIAVANSICTLTSGTTISDEVFIARLTDYPPLTFTFVLKASQRIINQDIYFGYGDNATTPSSDTMFARFHFTGTDNTKVCCETQSSADSGGSEGVGTQILLPLGATTANYLLYRIENTGATVNFYVGNSLANLVLIASNSIQVPNPYTDMYQRVRFANGNTPASPTTISVDTITCDNMNIINTQVNSGGIIGVNQSVSASAVNSSTTNLATGNSWTFTGTAESTLNVAGIQVGLFADKNCLVKVQQSPDGTNWDISDQYTYVASASFGVTVQAIASYFRVIVTTNSETTGSFRLQSVMCPIVEAVPRSLDSNGRLKISMGEDGYGFEAENTPTGDQRAVSPVKLVGNEFEGYTIDSNFWTATTAGGSGAAVIQTSGSLKLTSGTAASTTNAYSVRRARYIGGFANRYRAVIQNDAVTTNNIRRWGACSVANTNFTISVGTALVGNTYSNNGQYFTVLEVVSPTQIRCYGTGAAGTTTLTFVSGPGSGNLTFTASAVIAVPTDGAYFQLNGTTFSIATIKGGTVAPVSSGSFNGNLGYSWTPGTTVQIYEIYWTNSFVWFVVGGEVLHKVSASSAEWSNTNTLQVFQDTINSGVASSVSMYVRVATIVRMGNLIMQPMYRYISTATTTVCKYGPGTLQKIICDCGTAGVVTVYDNFAAVGPTLATITIKSGTSSNSFPVPFDIPFFNGLTIVTSAASPITVCYE